MLEVDGRQRMYLTHAPYCTVLQLYAEYHMQTHTGTPFISQLVPTTVIAGPYESQYFKVETETSTPWMVNISCS